MLVEKNNFHKCYMDWPLVVKGGMILRFDFKSTVSMWIAIMLNKPFFGQVGI